MKSEKYRMKRLLLIITILIGLSGIVEGAGTLTSVYLNPISGNDGNSGSNTLSPVRTWNVALSLAANNATIYVTGGSVPINTSTTINGSQYSATNITVMPNSGYTGALFSVSGGATATFTNITLNGVGASQALLSVNSGGTLTISSDLIITNGGQISLDGGANPINLAVTPSAGANYQLLTTYLSASDEGRAIVNNTAGVSDPLLYFTLIEPMNAFNGEYLLDLDGTTIRLYELPVGNIYIDPFSGNDSNSGARSNRPVKTLDRAMSLWDSRNADVPGIVTNIYVLSRITLTDSLTLDDGIKFTRFAGDAYRATSMTDIMIVYAGHKLTINDATIDNGSVSGIALNGTQTGILTLNNGAVITVSQPANVSTYIISAAGNIIINPGSLIINTVPGGIDFLDYCIGGSASITMNGGTILANERPAIQSTTLTMYDGVITSASTRTSIYCMNNITIHGGTINLTGGSVNITGNTGMLIMNGGTINHTGGNVCLNLSAVYGTSTINGGVINTTGTEAINNVNVLVINGGSIVNTRTSSGVTIQNRNTGTITMNGGTIDAGLTTAIVNGYPTLNKCKITSSNTTNGAIQTGSIIINGEDAEINGIINMINPNLEANNITVISSTVTQNYDVMLPNNAQYATLVKSNPSIDLGPYLSNFSLVPKAGYGLIAYAMNGGAIRNLVLYNTNGVYINDKWGSDFNSGASPADPLKTLVAAATITNSSPTQSTIYICDTTLTINTPHNVNQLVQRDTITSFMFGYNDAYLMHVVAGGSLIFGNVTLNSTATAAGHIYMDAGTTVILDAGTEIRPGAMIGIYQDGGSLTMKGGASIKQGGTAISGIYQTGNATTTLESGSLIEFVNGVQMESGTLTIEDNVIIQNANNALRIYGGVATIGKATIRNCVFNTTTVSVSNATLNINGTIIQNSGYQALNIYNSVVNMTDGQIINNGSSAATYVGAVNVGGTSIFNFSGGLIANNNVKAETNKSVFGEQVAISSSAVMNFTGGKIVGNQSDGNAISVRSTGATAATAARLIIGQNAVFENGFIYCNNPNFAPVSLLDPLHSSTLYKINLEDNMAGCVLVDGSTAAASLSNFELNPELATLSLRQSGADIVVNSSAIYLNGASGSDTNNGSTAPLAVKTFKRAKELLYNTGADYIKILGTVNLNNPDEISGWDLILRPDAIVQRGSGFTGFLVMVPSGYSLTLSHITIDGNTENINSSNAIIRTATATLTINEGTKIQNNRSNGVHASFGKVYINGGEITNNSSGIFLENGERADSLIMTGGSITKNSTGISGTTSYTSLSRYISITGGSISENTGTGVAYSGNISGILKIGGTANISNNGGSGVEYPSLDSLIIEGGQINSNGSNGITATNCKNVLVTGGEIRNNGGNGINASLPTGNYPGNSFRFSGVDVIGNGSFGISTSRFETCTITGVEISDNGSYGIYSTGATNLLISGCTISNNRSIGITAGATDLLISGCTINNNGNHGLNLSNTPTMLIKNVDINNNTGIGILVNSGDMNLYNLLNMEDVNIALNGNYGISLNGYLNYNPFKNIKIIGNKNSGIYSNTLLPNTITGDVLIKGNRATNGGGIYVNQGTVNISGNVTLEADTCNGYNTGGGGIYVAAAGVVNISGDVKIKDCVNSRASASTVLEGGSAIYALGVLNMTGGHITGCKGNINGTIFVSGAGGNVSLTGVNINNNTANQGAAIFVNAGGRVFLDSDTIKNNTTAGMLFTNPTTGDIHVAGGVAGRVSLRDGCDIDGVFFINSTQDSLFVDEALLSSDVGAFKLLARSSGAANSTTLVTQPGTVLVSPNGTTVTDASQFLSRFALVNQGIARGLDKGGTDEKHIVIVNQYFIDGTKSAGGDGSTPAEGSAFNSIAQLTSTVLGSPYTTVWVSGPVTTTGNDVLPLITESNVNIRRYTGFAVAAQPYPAYDSVMFTINEGATLTIPGGNNLADNLTISGEGGSAFSDASIFKNNGTLNISGFTTLYDNPTNGNGGAVYQNGVFNLSGNVEFDVQSNNTIYLTEGKVINIIDPLTGTSLIGVTVETSTHVPGRIIATGTTVNVPAGMESRFVNEITSAPLPIGRRENGSSADLMFYIADRNVTGVPIYTSLQDAFDAAVSANNDEVRLYGDVREHVVIDKTLRYRSMGFDVSGSFTLDSTSNVQLLDDLHADTLYIRATTFAKKAQLDRGVFNVLITKAAYLDLRLPENPIVSDWYPVNLPFESNISDVRNALDTTYSLGILSDYAIAGYDGQRRANFGIGNQPSSPDNDWQYFTGSVMNEGTGYMVTTAGIQTLRFKAANLNLFNVTTVPFYSYSGSAGAIHQGFNYIAQPMGINSAISGGVSGFIQASESLSSDRIGSASYVVKMVAPSLVIAPYTNYFYQAGASGTVSYTKSGLAATVRSGKITSSDTYSVEAATHSSEVPLYYELRLHDGNPERYDALFVAASEYASKDNYEIGRDVVKMGTIGGHTMQLWSIGFDVALCVNEVTLESMTAEIPLSINTPISGKEYKLNLKNVVSWSEQLWLCRDGKAIQNLTQHPEYTIEGVGGLIDEYSLRILTGTTSNKTVEAGETYVYTENKTIVIAGIHPEDEYMIYDASGRLYTKGKADSNRKRINAGTGFYVIQINGKTYKAVVN